MTHIINGEFQSDKYPTCPPGKVPLSVKDEMTQDLLWEYAVRRFKVDQGFCQDLQTALIHNGYEPMGEGPESIIDARMDEIKKIAEENTKRPEILKDWEDDIHEQ